MTTIVERVEDDAGSSAEQPSAAPLVIDDATLERLAVLLRAGQQPPARSAWQTSLLITLAGALIAAATAGYFSLRGDIAALGTALRAENAALEESLRGEIAALGTGLRAENAALEESLRGEMAALEESLRTELREFRAEFNEVALDHTQRLARLEAAHPHPAQ